MVFNVLSPQLGHVVMTSCLRARQPFFLAFQNDLRWTTRWLSNSTSSYFPACRKFPFGVISVSIYRLSRFPPLREFCLRGSLCRLLLRSLHFSKTGLTTLLTTLSIQQRKYLGDLSLRAVSLDLNFSYILNCSDFFSKLPWRLLLCTVHRASDINILFF